MNRRDKNDKWFWQQQLANDWRNQAAFQPVITTSGTTNVYYGAVGELQSAPAPEPEPEGPLEWLRGQVEEMCELGRAA